MKMREEATLRIPPVSRTRVILSQVIACLALDVLLLGLGMSITFVTMVVPDVLNAEEGISIDMAQASWLGSMAFLCQPLGSIFSGPLLDYFGRRKALFLVNIPHLIAWLLMYCAWDVRSLFIANALLGMGTGIMEAPSITYVGEITDPKIRGTLTTLTNCFTSAGMFVAYLVGSVLPWQQAALVSLVVPLATMALVILVPETPIWLLSKGRQKQALNSLRKVRGWARPEDVKEEFDELLQYSSLISQCAICARNGLADISPCEHSNYNIFKRVVHKFKHVFFVKETIRPFTLVMLYFFFHTMSGFTPVRSNMVNLCKALGMVSDSKLIVVFIGVLYVVMNIVAAVVVKSFGKRKLIVSSMFGCAFSSLAISLYCGITLPPNVFSYETSTFPEGTEILPVFLFMMLVSFNSLGIPWILLSEVFPFRSRGMATSLAAALTYMIFFFASKTNYDLESYFHLSGTFAIYSFIGFVGAIYLYFFLPETEKKSLVEIEAFYKGNHKIFADDFFINTFRKKVTNDADNPMLVQLK